MESPTTQMELQIKLINNCDTESFSISALLQKYGAVQLFTYTLDLFDIVVILISYDLEVLASPPPDEDMRWQYLLLRHSLLSG